MSIFLLTRPWPSFNRSSPWRELYLSFLSSSVELVSDQPSLPLSSSASSNPAASNKLDPSSLTSSHSFWAFVFVFISFSLSLSPSLPLCSLSFFSLSFSRLARCHLLSLLFPSHGLSLTLPSPLITRIFDLSLTSTLSFFVLVLSQLALIHDGFSRTRAASRSRGLDSFPPHLSHSTSSFFSPFSSIRAPRCRLS